MDPIIDRNDEQFRPMRIVRLLQEIRIIAVVEENDMDDEDIVVERQIIIDSLQRPLPVPYNEEQ